MEEFEPNHFKEGVNLSSAFGSLALMNRAPHPNAAKVFINWLLSRDGQALFQKNRQHPGRRAQFAAHRRAQGSHPLKSSAARQNVLFRYR